MATPHGFLLHISECGAFPMTSFAAHLGRNALRVSISNAPTLGSRFIDLGMGSVSVTATFRQRAGNESRCASQDNRICGHLAPSMRVHYMRSEKMRFFRIIAAAAILFEIRSRAANISRISFQQRAKRA
jgi:hypothetical protein